MKTKFNAVPNEETWIRTKNHCRTTDNKDFTEKSPTGVFKKKLLMSEHTPIRLLEFDWSWKGILRTYAYPAFGVRLVVERDSLLAFN